MSNAKIPGVTSAGYQGPFSPPCLDELQQGLYAVPSQHGGWVLSSLAEHIPGFVGSGRATTSDKYFWYCSLRFTLSEGEVMILFPWAQDWKGTDGTSADRHIALYTSRECADADIERIVIRLSSSHKAWLEQVQDEPKPVEPRAPWLE